MTNLRVEPLLDQHLKPIRGGDELTPLNISTEKVTYAKEPTENYEIVNKKYADKHYWQSHSFGGAKANNNSSTYYYTRAGAESDRWVSYDTSPTGVTVAIGTLSHVHVAVKNGYVTKFNFTGYAGDTGFDDPFRFYIFTGIPVDNGASTFLTEIYMSSRITPTTTAKNIVLDEELSAKIVENQRLYVFFKKDSTSANQDLSFNATISGYYIV